MNEKKILLIVSIITIIVGLLTLYSIYERKKTKYWFYSYYKNIENGFEIGEAITRNNHPFVTSSGESILYYKKISKQEYNLYIIHKDRK